MDEAPQVPETSEPPVPGAPLESQAPGIPESQADSETKKKKKDFWIGLLGSLIGNLLLMGLCSTAGVIAAFLLSPAVRNSPNAAEIMLAVVIAINALPLVVNIAVLIFFLVKHRPGIVMGMLVSYGLGLLLTVIGGVLVWAICFSSGGWN